MPIYELINPSDSYTFEAPSIEVAAVAVLQLSSSCGATQLTCVPDDEEPPSTPVMFGWPEWLLDRGIDDAWVEAHLEHVADALESMRIGSLVDREDIEQALALIPKSKRQEWLAKRQDRLRISLSKIGERAWEVAALLRQKA